MFVIVNALNQEDTNGCILNIHDYKCVFGQGGGYAIFLSLMGDHAILSSTNGGGSTFFFLLRGAVCHPPSSAEIYEQSLIPVVLGVNTKEGKLKVPVAAGSGFMAHNYIFPVRCDSHRAFSVEEKCRQAVELAFCCKRRELHYSQAVQEEVQPGCSAELPFYKKLELQFPSLTVKASSTACLHFLLYSLAALSLYSQVVVPFSYSKQLVLQHGCTKDPITL